MYTLRTLIIGMMVGCLHAVAHAQPLPDGIKTELEKPMVIETPAEFPGGNVALMEYFTKNIEYPEIENIQGSVIVNFVIDTTGKVTNAKIMRSVHPMFDAEAIRVVMAMPLWTAGRQAGKKVNVQYNLPIRFAYNEKRKKSNKRKDK